MTIKDIPYYNFYQKYHKNKINKIIHIICCPLIIWTLSVFLNSLVLYFSLNYVTSFNFLKLLGINCTLSFILLSIYLLVYTFIDITCFIPMSVYLFIIWASSYLFLCYSSFPFYYALLINIFSWTMQIIGYVFFEKNIPVLLDSIEQALLMGPFITYYEFIQMGLY